MATTVGEARLNEVIKLAHPENQLGARISSLSLYTILQTEL